MLLWNKLSKGDVQMEQVKEKGKPSERSVPMEPIKEKDKPSEENVPMEPMKEKDKPSEGMIFQRKEPCTVEEKTFQIENDKVKLDNVNELLYYKSFISID